MNDRYPDNGGGRRNLLKKHAVHPQFEITLAAGGVMKQLSSRCRVLFSSGLTGPFCFPPDRFAPATGSLDLKENILVLFIALEVI